MNVLEEVIIKSPNNIDEKCGKFTIDDVTDPFILSSITRSGEHYMFSAWIKSSVAGTVSIYGEKINTTTEWSKYEIGFSSNGTGVNILFEVSATYYFYHSKLEIGNKATDWTPAPEDMVDKANIISCINQTPESITIQANKISLEGLITANSNFKILQDGSMETIAGKIGGWSIGDNKIYSENAYNKTWTIDTDVYCYNQGTSKVNINSKADSDKAIDVLYEYDEWYSTDTSNVDKCKSYLTIKNDGMMESKWVRDACGEGTDISSLSTVIGKGEILFETEGYGIGYKSNIRADAIEFYTDETVSLGLYPNNINCDGDITSSSDIYANGSQKVVHDGRFKTSTQSITTDHYGQASLTRPSDFAYALGIHSEDYQYGVFWVNGLNIRVYDIASSEFTRVRDVTFKVSLNYVTK